jgi:putative transport protein
MLSSAAPGMNWFTQLLRDPSSTAHAIVVLAAVAAAGLAIGAIRVYRIHLGVAGVLFAGLAVGHFGFEINHDVLDFAREFGLILFVYTIGVQVGPGFAASLRKSGLPLNLMAAAVVIGGAVTTLLLWRLFMDRGDLPAAVGVFSGATTNTPSLAAAGEALRDTVPADQFETLRVLPGLGYAVSYPFGVIGIILTILLTRVLFRVDPKAETAALEKLQRADRIPIATANLEVTNPNVIGVPLSRVPSIPGVVISRVFHAGQLALAKPDTVLSAGDVLLAVGPRDGLDQLALVIGPPTALDLTKLPSRITARRMLVTHSAVLGSTIAELRLRERFGVSVTRVERNAVELPVTDDIHLQFGDRLTVVGDEDSIPALTAELGDSIKRLNAPQMIPIFLGIAIGVIVGSIPFKFPGLPSAVKLGMAGGPLLVAIVLSRLGNIGPLVWYLPSSASIALRDVGIALFLACVGIKSGGHFVETLTHGHGVTWMLCGIFVTIVPMLIVAAIARLVLKVNYLTLCGLLAGSMTDPPALAFATTMTGSEAPSVAYASVYPLTMILRVLCAQLMIVLFK